MLLDGMTATPELRREAVVQDLVEDEGEGVGFTADLCGKGCCRGGGNQDQENDCGISKEGSRCLLHDRAVTVCEISHLMPKHVVLTGWRSV